jgi:medium-chain acyl-[acyl-carrier-protein] hydrolase
MQTNNLWFPFVSPNPAAQVRLFCFHYAGGRAGIFRQWLSMAPRWLQVVTVELPGRGARLREELFCNLDALVDALRDMIGHYLNMPFAFFGHSMGGIICFELARALRRAGQKRPIHLFLSAHRAPHLPNPRGTTYDLPHDAFIEKIAAMNGTPAIVLKNPELLELIVPILRADFEICDTYSYVEEPPLKCPFTVFGGKDDRVVPPEMLPSWVRHTTSEFQIHTFCGDHFFFHEVEKQVLQIVSEQLAQTLKLQDG